MERHEEAIADLITASKSSPEDSQISYKQGLTYYAHKKFKKCINIMK